MTTIAPTKPVEISIHKIFQSDDNPRVELQAIEELAASIKAFGIIQPLIVRPLNNSDTYELVAGHRRLEAARVANLTTVPCVLRETKGDLVRHHLIENTQRVDLTPFEIGISVYSAMSEGLKQKELGAQLGKSEAWVSKYKTIGEAADAATEDSQEMADLVQCSDAEKCYNLARQILGLDGKVSKTKGAKEKQKQLLPKTLDEVLADRAEEKGCGQVEGIKAEGVKDGKVKDLFVTIVFNSEQEAIRFFSN